MQYIQILSLLACAQIAMAVPISQETSSLGIIKRASQSPNAPQNPTSSTDTSSKNKNVKSDSVSQAVKKFAKDTDIVSNAINMMPSMTDQAAIKALAQKAIDAENDEGKQRKILVAAAGSAGDSANGKILKNAPTVVDRLQAITKDASSKSVLKNIKLIEGPRNANILPSITQLSKAALKAVGLNQAAPKFKPTTGASGNNKKKSGNDSDSKTNTKDNSSNKDNKNN